MESFKTQFTLSREYLGECFDESLPHGKNAKPNYLFPIVSFVVGVYLLQFTEQPGIVGAILIALAVLELLHIRYRRAWWLARQMWGASANSEVTVVVDDNGIETQSLFVKTMLPWKEIEKVIETDLGHILVDKNSTQQYLSKSLFPEGLLESRLKVKSNIE